VNDNAALALGKLRGHDEVGLGNVLGSNIFNVSFILAVAAVISPIIVDLRDAAVALAVGLLTVAFTLPVRGGFISRRRGVVLLLVYVAYLGLILPRRAVMRTPERPPTADATR
jgi:cation:H+ antiporter